MRLSVVLAVGLAASGCTACKEKHADRPAGVTEADARELATWMSEHMTHCDEDMLAARIDGKALAARLAPATSKDPAQEAAHQTCAWMQGIQSYTLVGIRTVDGVPTPIMRRLLVSPTDGQLLVNYDRITLSRTDPAPKTHIVDLFSYRQGLSIADVLAARTPSPDIAKARELIGAGKQDEAFALVAKLPANTRRDLMLRAYLQARVLPAEQQKQARDELIKAFPDDPAIALTLIDADFALEDYAAVHHWIDVLAKDTGPDAYLDTLHAIAYLEAGDLDKALAAADAAIKRETTLTRAHEVRLDILISRKDWPATLAELTELETNHGMTFDEAKLRAEPRLAELVSTPEFAAWVATPRQPAPTDAEPAP